MLDKYTYSNREVLKMSIRDIICGRNKDMVTFGGLYSTWEEAEKQCSGYDAEEIFNKVKSAALAVRDGKALFERDGYLFYQKHINFQILAILLSIYMKNGKLDVLDFGGSLGSMYFQHKDVLEKLNDNLNWTVVEQKHFVEFGKKELSDNFLKFEYCMSDVKECNCIIFGSVLQYIKNYLPILEEALKRGCKYIIIDKTPVSSAEWISVEQVHEPIYEASYAMRILKKDELLHIFNKYGYKMVENWEPEVGTDFRVKDKKCVFESMLFVKE